MVNEIALRDSSEMDVSIQATAPIERRGVRTSIYSEISTGHHHQSHGLGGSSRTIRAAGRIIKPGVERSQPFT